MTTAGAVEYAKRVEVARDDEDFEAEVVFVSTDCDVALLTVGVGVWVVALSWTEEGGGGHSELPDTGVTVLCESDLMLYLDLMVMC